MKNELEAKANMTPLEDDAMDTVSGGAFNMPKPLCSSCRTTDDRKVKSYPDVYGNITYVCVCGNTWTVKRS